MKICIIGSSGVPIPPRRGGAVERHIYDLARFLAKRNCEVHIFTLRPKNAAQEEILENIHLHRGGFFEESSSIKKAFWKHFSFFFYILVRLPRIEADVIHAHNGIPGLAALLVSRIRGIPFIFTNHTSYTSIQHKIVRESTELKNRFEDLQVSLEKFCAKNSSYAIAISRKVREGLVSIGVSANKIFLVPNGVDAQKFRQNSEKATQIRERFHLVKNKVVLYVGRIVKYKGLDYLVDSAPQIIEEHPDVKFVIVGPVSYYSTNIPTPYYEELKKKIESQKLLEYFVFCGAVNDEDLIGLYSACDVFILPSVSEPFGMSLIEAMSCQKPVIGTRIDGIVDVIHDGKDGYLINPAQHEEITSKIIALLNHPEKMRKMGQFARKHVEEIFDWDTLTPRLMEIYRKAINKNRGQPK